MKQPSTETFVKKTIDSIMEEVSKKIDSHESFASNIETKVQLGAEDFLLYLNGEITEPSDIKNFLDQIKILKISIDEIEQKRENDKKKLTEAQESLKQAKERLDKVSRPGLFGGIDERRVREKEATVQVELESLDQAVST